MIEHLPQALSSLSAALNIGKSLVDISDMAKRQEALIQFNSVIIDAQSKIMASQSEKTALTAKVDELEKECVRLKDWKAEREKYTRKEIGPGAFVYIANDYMGNLRSAHKYCCDCFDSYKKSTLQQSKTETNIKLSCHNRCPDIVFHHYIDVT
ncbi:MAG: hypothetical protein A2521_01715 [Deltaproteobacteria bacterium RIFOXYD12_FULL_57_12]|nr:MAG: hypothetical protein A2521_01715 [Deltaproteobacteria bacterium RIFOXYD12_FULL_57_12]